MNTPYMIDWAITNRCNLDCLYCRGMDKDELDSRTILRVAEEIPSLKPRWVIVEGGEPLLRRELFEIIKVIHNSNIKIYLISNGMLFNEDYVASILVSMHNPPKEIILSGRLTDYDFIKVELTRRLNKYAPVVKVNKLSRIVKEAACGAYIIGEGLLGGKYRRLVENMAIAKWRLQSANCKVICGL